MIGLLQASGLAQSSCRACGKDFRGKDQGLICELCLEGLRPYHPMDYSQKIDYVSSYRVFGLYEGVLKEVLHCIKFYNSKTLALRLGRALRDHLWEYVDQVQPDVVTFPALNLRRFWSRGFNHVEHILKGAGLPSVKLFRRVDLSPPLALLSKEERQRAVTGHRLREDLLDLVENKRVLVVDDLLTTGSTLRRLAYLLLSVGASEVHAYIVARG